MKTLTTKSLWLGLTLLLAPLASAQEGEKPKLEDQNPLQQDDSQSEIRELFKQVELKLRRIDRLLLDASTGDSTALKEVTGSGMDDLLDEATPQSQSGAGMGSGLSGMLSISEREGQSVLSGIDRIIEIAQEQGSASGACSKPDPNAPSPLDRGKQQTEKNSTPEQPKPDPNGQKENEQEGEDPKKPQASDAADQNKPSDKTPDQDTQDPNLKSDDLEQWGDLPVHVRDVFRAEGGKKMPSQYRDWIDSYYRRLNARSGN